MSAKTSHMKKKPIFLDRDGLADVVDSRPSARPRVTSDDIDEEVAESSSAIVQRGETRTLAFGNDDGDAKRRVKDPVHKLLNPQSESCKQRAKKTSRLLEIEVAKLELKRRELKMKANQASVDLALKKIQLEMTQRESVVKLVLARKQLLDNGIALADIDSLLPPPV
ncbi:unnamed protein product [Phytophthora fragariaefolia]|uniref:Unnamed protein product n=1 Tax=Phytophthora fragariaefolia TaxID=1490495 RepID=A0A9W7CVK2_9STRA|nr:unnamed protein product [Phytophthora fragariaefolia]